MAYRRNTPTHSLLLALSLTAGCASYSATINQVSGDTDAGTNDAGSRTGGKANTGGASSTAGTKSVGGSSSAGGSTSVAGTSNIGGNSSAGGIASAGGSSATTGGTSTLVSTLGGSSSTGGTSAAAGTPGAGGQVATGGSKSAGGTTPSGGTVATGGIPSTGGTPTIGGTASAGGVSSTGGVTATGGSSQLVCSGGTTNCSGSCVNLQSDKANCNSCGSACESYQFCGAGTCLPHYISTKILPTTALASDASQQIVAAAVETNKAQGDLLVQVLLTDASITMSSPSDTYTTQVSANTPSGATGYYASGLARYTATGTLVWGRDLGAMLGTTSQPISPNSLTPIVLASNGDVVLAYDKSDPPVAPPGTTYWRYRFARVNGNNANVTWEANYPGSDAALTIVPRNAKNDFITFGGSPGPTSAPYGGVCQVVDQGTSATVTHLSTVYSIGAAPGADGSTVWLWGGGGWGYGGTFALNPWSTQTWAITGNPGQGQGYDAIILGAQDNGQTIGPWMSEGDWGPTYKVAVDASGDLIVGARSGGYTTFNGGQDFLPTAGQVLAKIDHSTGQIVWRTSISALPTIIVAAPGGRIVTMVQQLDPNTQAPIATAPYQLNIYSGADGSMLSSFSTGMMAQTLATGSTDLFVLGAASAAADFNPGSATDTQGSPAGVFVSRFSF